MTRRARHLRVPCVLPRFAIASMRTAIFVRFAAMLLRCLALLGAASSDAAERRTVRARREKDRFLVVAYGSGTVLAVRQFPPGSDVYVGTAITCDVIAPRMSCARHLAVSGGARLNLLPSSEVRWNAHGAPRAVNIGANGGSTFVDVEADFVVFHVEKPALTLFIRYSGSRLKLLFWRWVFFARRGRGLQGQVVRQGRGR